MIERLKVNGYLALLDAEVHFTPLTLLLGRNGAGKSALLDSLERLGSYARGGVDRAFGPPPYSLGFLKSHGHGDISATTFEVDLSLPDEGLFRYRLSLADRNGRAEVREERVIRLSSGEIIASWSYKAPPASGTILRPDAPNPTLERIASQLKMVRVFDLNPREIERPSEDDQTLSRDGFGVGAFLGRMQETEPARFEELGRRLKSMRPGTAALRVWGGAAGQIFWGIEETHTSDWRYPAPLLSWGDRVLVGILCLLFDAEPGSAIGLEEVDRGFHPSRYDAVVDLLSEASSQGVGGRGPVQVIATSHSPALVSRFQDRLDELRLVSRAGAGTTRISSMKEEVEKRLGASKSEAPIGDVWAMGLLD